MEYLSFKEAFKDAKKAGDKSFTFQGKRYTTATAEEQRSAVVAKAATGSGRGSAAGRRASDEDSGSATIPRGSEKAPKSTGESTSGLSNMEKLLIGLGGAGAAGAAYKGYRMATAADRARKAEMAAERSASKAALEFSKGKAAQTSSDTGRKFSAKQEMEAAESTMRGATNRKTIAEARSARDRAMQESKKEAMKADSKKSSPRSKTREEEDIEFRKGGMAKKKPAAMKRK